MKSSRANEVRAPLVAFDAYACENTTVGQWPRSARQLEGRDIGWALSYDGSMRYAQRGWYAPAEQQRRERWQEKAFRTSRTLTTQR
jgi:hypothetical protein